MPSILFVCTANRFRSPFAAALFTRILKDRGIAEDWQIGSAGTWALPGQPALQRVVSFARSSGIDLSAHSSRRVSQRLLSDYDLILVMQSSHREALLTEFPELTEHIYLLSDVVERGSYDIPDSLKSEAGIREVLTELQDLLQRGQDNICVLATYLYNGRLQARLQHG
jgi:protein-tyrosine phosphatase